MDSGSFLADLELRPLTLADAGSLEPIGLAIGPGSGGLEIAVTTDRSQAGPRHAAQCLEGPAGRPGDAGSVGGPVRRPSGAVRSRGRSPAGLPRPRHRAGRAYLSLQPWPSRIVMRPHGFSGRCCLTSRNRQIPGLRNSGALRHARIGEGCAATLRLVARTAEGRESA